MSRNYRLYLLLALITLIAGCGRSAPEPTPTPQPTTGAHTQSASSVELSTIVAMGDSLTEGLNVDLDKAYPAQLERKLLADGYGVEVINAGISGETSSSALSRVDWVLTLEPDIVILETGANDGLRGIEPSLTAQNIDALLARFGKEGVIVVLAGMQIVQNMGEQYVEEFRSIYPEAAETHDAILIPFFLEGVGGVPELNQADGIHPTADGYAVVVETIYPFVIEALEQIGE